LPDRTPRALPSFPTRRSSDLVTNRLPEATAVHWHGQTLPNGMDGVAGLTQPGIPPGKTFVYEFILRRSGTFMYHPHSDEMIQMRSEEHTSELQSRRDLVCRLL